MAFQMRALCVLLLSLHVTGMGIMRSEEGTSGGPGGPSASPVPAPSLELSVVGIVYGGAEHRDSAGGQMYRPEAVHTETCDPINKVCTACASKEACWHGIDGGAHGGNLAINVPAGVPKKEHVAVIWASCPSASGYWKVFVTEEVNAQFSVYLNGLLAEDIRRDTSGEIRSYHFTSAQIGANAQIKLVLLPNDPIDPSSSSSSSQDGKSLTQASPQASSAAISIVTLVNQWVQTCMDGNFCLNRLGRNNDASFALRNNNRYQYECLSGNPSTSTLDLTDVCNQWRACFADQSGGENHEAQLLTLLRVVFGNGNTNGKKKPEKAKKASNKAAAASKNLLAVSSSPEEGPSQPDPDRIGCTDPESQDAEAFECECLADVTTDCEAADPPVEDTEACIKTWMCNQPRICDSWKRGNCAGTLLERRSNMTLKASGTLDDSVTGKCTSSTRGL